MDSTPIFKRISPKPSQTVSKIRKRGITPHFTVRPVLPQYEGRQRPHKKIVDKIPSEHGHKNPQESIRKYSSSMLKGLYIMTKWDLYHKHKGGLTHEKSLNVICHINRMKQKNPRDFLYWCRKRICQNPTHFMIKTHNKLGLERNFLSMIKVICERIECIPPKIRNPTIWMHAFATPIQQRTEGSNQGDHQASRLETKK